MAGNHLDMFKIFFRFYFILPFSLLSLVKFCEAEEILGCGGFVKSEVGINYSRVELKLYTKKGSLKYQTDCAPNNGYYLIPLYDKGDYILKVEHPAGWSFEPSSMSLHIDGRSDPCSLGQDINFHFKGFSVTGMVTSKGLSEGPGGIMVTLKKMDDTVIKTVQSNPGGVYLINKVLSGKYIVEASHPTWQFEKSKTTVSVVDDNAKTDEALVIRGYDVKGQVLSEGEPIRGVHFILFSRDDRLAAKDLQSCERKPVQGFSTKSGLVYLCHVTSSDDGKFLFPAVPPGLYKLVPFYKGENIEFDVTPPEVDFAVIHGTVAFQDPFQVQGFSVSGRVVASPGGRGISGAKVFLDGMKQAVTQNNGIYHLENMKTGSYKLEVSADHIYFDATTVKITPNTSQLPELVASKFSLCGQLKVAHHMPGIHFDVPRTLLQIHSDGKEDKITTDKEMRFCSSLKPGKYTFKPVITATEAAAGLKFLPAEKVINIVDEPILEIVFSQFSADVSGSALCLNSCGELKFALESAEGIILKNFVSDPNGAFRLSNLLPGNYFISILKHDWCWKEEKVSFAIVDQNVSKLEFRHVGYQMPITSSHATEIKVTKPNGQTESLHIPQGTSFHCLLESGLYKLSPVGCHLFGKDSILFDTRQPSHVVLTATKHKVSGSILTDSNVSDITVSLRYVNSDSPAEVLKLLLPIGKEGQMFKYSFSLQLPTHTTVEFVPSASRLLFKPRTSKVVVLDDCMMNMVSFRGQTGLFINGEVRPPIEGVTVTISETSGAQTPVTTTQTDAAGKFTVGPFDHDSKFQITAEKEGYIFKPTDKLGQFEAFKFADVDVEVTNENGEPLSGVLLSLSGGVDYRKNSVTPKDGHLLFSGLSPGQYFLRPMMKEYNFDPPSKIIDVDEGASVKVKVSGKREAFSCFGITNSVTGETEAGVVVEAVGVAGGPCSSYQEEASSEQDGTFRIRGLKPECQYVVRLKEEAEGNQHIERAAPREQIIKVTSGDISGIRLIIFRHFNQMDISGNVVTSQEYLSSLKVRLSYENSPDQAVYTVPLGQSSFFHLPALPMDNRVYILKLDSSLSSSIHHIETSSFTFRANTSYRHFTLRFHPRPKLPEQEVTQGSLLALPLTLVLAALAYNYSKVIQLLNQGFDIFQSLVITPVRASVQECQSEPVAARRKVKLRRVQ